MTLTYEKHAQLIEGWLGQGWSYRQIGEELGCWHGTVAAFVKKHYPDKVRVAANGVAQPVANGKPDEVELLRHEVKQLRSSANKHRAIDVQAEALLQEIRSTVTPAAPVYEPPEAAEGDGHPHVHVLLLSDFHLGEVVQSEAVNGLNEFNYEILLERMGRIQQALRSFQNARPYPIDELVIGWLGDMNGGANHHELAVTNEFSVAEQCILTGDLLGQWTEPLVEDYPKITIVGVAGNHPRVELKPASKQVFNNFDWLSYKRAEQYLANYSTIECHFPMSGYHVHEVAGRNMLFFHGDGIRSTMPGVPWGGVMRRVNELKKSYTEQGTLLSYFALGHFHQANVVQGSIFMNGSVKGLDEYSLKQFGAGERPTQLLLTFDRTKQRLTDASFITP